MSSDPLLDKMDALLNKHRGDANPPPPDASAPPASSPPPLPDDAWLPVLTDVVTMGKPAADQPAAAPAHQEPDAALAASPLPTAAIFPDELAEQIMDELTPRLSAMLRDRIAADIHDSLDDTLSTLLAQMDVHIREIVRETLKEELGKS